MKPTKKTKRGTKLKTKHSSRRGVKRLSVDELSTQAMELMNKALDRPAKPLDKAKSIQPPPPPPTPKIDYDPEAPWPTAVTVSLPAQPSPSSKNTDQESEQSAQPDLTDPPF